MKNINKRPTRFLFVLFSFMCLSIMFPCQIVADELDDFFDHECLVEDLAPSESSFTKLGSSASMGSFSAHSFSEDDILDVLRQVDLVNDPLWRRTFFARTRDALYLMPHARMIGKQRNSGVNIRTFFNKTTGITFPFLDSCSLSLNRENIEIIINLAQDAIAGALGLPAGTTIDADSLFNILPRLNDLSIEGRKSGYTLEYYHKLGALTLGFESSLLLTERNAFASDRVQQEVKALAIEALGGGPLPPSDFDEVREFARIKIGLGDTRLSAGLQLIDRSRFYLNLGTSVIIPTGNRGILRDGRFKKPSELESNNALDFVINPPRELLLVPRLGHQGHFGVGCAAESKLSLFDNTVDIRARVAYDHLFSGEERRLAMFKKRLPPLEATVDQFRKQYLIPTEVSLQIYPGGIFTGLIGLDYHWGDFMFTAGYDFYLQQREDFGKISGGCFDPSELKLPCAMQGTVQEHHGTIAVHYTKKSNGMLFGIGGDWTLQASGSANSWTVFAQLSIPF